MGLRDPCSRRVAVLRSSTAGGGARRGNKATCGNLQLDVAVLPVVDVRLRGMPEGEAHHVAPQGVDRRMAARMMPTME
jgi:hypothetical protein